nr:hypothetical protein [uncultured Bacteroides sp.]
MQKTEISNIKSRDVSDILGKPPTTKLHFLGYSLYLIIFVTFLSTNFIPYSTIISEDIEIIDYTKDFNKKQKMKSNNYSLNSINSYEKINKLYSCENIGGLIMKKDSLVKPMKIHREKDILYVINSNPHFPIEGKIYLLKKHKKRIEKGAPIKIVLNNFSEMEFGYIEGLVERYSYSDKGFQELIVSFPNGMLTDKNITINISKKISGKAYIKLSTESLFKKILNQILKI